MLAECQGRHGLVVVHPRNQQRQVVLNLAPKLPQAGPGWGPAWHAGRGGPPAGGTRLQQIWLLTCQCAAHQGVELEVALREKGS